MLNEKQNRRGPSGYLKKTQLFSRQLFTRQCYQMSWVCIFSQFRRLDVCNQDVSRAVFLLKASSSFWWLPALLGLHGSSFIIPVSACDHMVFLLCICLCTYFPLLIRTSALDQICSNSSQLDYTCKDRIFESGCIHRYWELELKHLICSP